MIQIADQLFATDQLDVGTTRDLVQQVVAWHSNVVLLYFQIWEGSVGAPGILRYTFPLITNQILNLEWTVKPVEFARPDGSLGGFKWAFQTTPTVYAAPLGLGVGYVSWRLIQDP